MTKLIGVIIIFFVLSSFFTAAQAEKNSLGYDIVEIGTVKHTNMPVPANPVYLGGGATNLAFALMRTQAEKNHRYLGGMGKTESPVVITAANQWTRDTLAEAANANRGSVKGANGGSRRFSVNHNSDSPHDPGMAGAVQVQAGLTNRADPDLPTPMGY